MIITKTDAKTNECKFIDTELFYSNKFTLKNEFSDNLFKFQLANINLLVNYTKNSFFIYSINSLTGEVLAIQLKGYKNMKSKVNHILTNQ